MRNKFIIVVSIIGVLLGITAAYLMSKKNTPLPPAFTPAANPFRNGIFANGIVEADQSSGENINIYPEVAGTVTSIKVKDGDLIPPGTVLFTLEDSIQRANLATQRAQVSSAEAQYKNTNDIYQKTLRAWQLNHQAVSQDNLDSTHNANNIAKANLEVARQQYQSTLNLLKKYEVRTSVGGTVLTINAAVGGFVSTQGVYDSYTRQNIPPLVMGSQSEKLSVRCFVDEILISRLPETRSMKAYLYIRGTDHTIPLTFKRILPLVTPKIELSSQRLERVDVRVLPIVFDFSVPKNLTLYPGQLVDVYIGASNDETKPTTER